MTALLADTLFAQARAGPFWGYTFVEVAIAIVVIAAVVGLVYVALQQFGVAIPPFIIRIFWIVVAAVLVIAAIKFVAGIV